jgi:molybdenum cofactor biosynthesis enzyme MoaA
MNYYELEPKDNHFYSVFVDITHKCNMECANCYVPIRTVPDLDVDKLYAAIKKFPKRTEIRLIGGEPTVRTDLIDIVKNIRNLGHRPTMMTNGLKLASQNYAKDLFDAGMISIYISMNGADNDRYYKILDGMECAERKLKAWQECVNAHMNVNIGSILQKGVNDDVPGRLLALNKQFGGHNILRFRNVGQIGRFAIDKNKNWTFNEMVNLVCSQLGIDPEWAKKWNSVNGHNEQNVIFFPLDETKRMKSTWIKITDWSPATSLIPDPNSLRRGRLTQDFKIAPFFEHVKKYENIY